MTRKGQPMERDLTEAQYDLLTRANKKPKAGVLVHDEDAKEVLLSLSQDQLVCDPHDLNGGLYTRITEKGVQALDDKGAAREDEWLEISRTTEADIARITRQRDALYRAVKALEQREQSWDDASDVWDMIRTTMAEIEAS